MGSQKQLHTSLRYHSEVRRQRFFTPALMVPPPGPSTAIAYAAHEARLTDSATPKQG